MKLAWYNDFSSKRSFSCSFYQLRNDPTIAKSTAVKKSAEFPFISRCSTGFLCKVHAKSTALEFPSGFPEQCASREEEESPTAITREEKVTAAKRENETALAALVSLSVFLSTYNRDRQRERRRRPGRRRGYKSERSERSAGTGFPWSLLWCV